MSLDILIRAKIVLVLENPASVPTVLVRGTSNLVKIESPDTDGISYIVGSISRLLDVLSLTIGLYLGVEQEAVYKSFGLRSESVLCGLVFLGLQQFLENSVKLWGAWPMARLLGEVLPPEKHEVDYTYLFGKRVRRFILSRIFNGSFGRVPKKKAAKLANSILCLKDATKPVSKQFVEASFEAYKNTLSKPPDSERTRFLSWREGGGEGKEEVKEQWEGYKYIMEQIRASIVKTVREVFKPVDCHQLNDEGIIPSCSSSLQSKRSEGGAWQELLLRSSGEAHYQRVLEQRESEERMDAGEDEKKVVDRATADFEYISRLRTNHPLPFSRLATGLLPDALADQGSLLRMDWSPQSGLIVTRGHPIQLSGRFVYGGRRVRARVVPILEPCKVRWVSIGESQAYFKAKAWNRLVYQQMPRHPTFQLTGRPLTEEDVNTMVHKFLLSGDYKGATDTLDPYWSEVVFEEISKRLYGPSWAERVLGLKSMLTGHSLVYKDPTGQCHEFEQANGQLMGSFLSFPVLCVLNAAINRLYLDTTLSTPVAELPLLINGDDVMMSAEHDFSDWAPFVGLVGLKPSLGKNYVHTHVACLNSEFYRRETVPDVTEVDFDPILLSRPVVPGQFERIYPWRTNLCYGQDSDLDSGLFGLAANRPDFLSNCTLGSMARTLVEHQPPKEAAQLLTKFIKENGKALKGTNRSWWTPEQLGGLGLPLNQDTIKLITPLARTVATYMLTRPSPEDCLIYAPRGASAFTKASKAWMASQKDLMPTLGYEYRWSTDDDVNESVSPPVPLRDFLGFGSVPQSPNYQGNYHKLVKLAQAAKCLSPVSDEKLLEFVSSERRAGWFPMAKVSPPPGSFLVHSALGKYTARPYSRICYCDVSCVCPACV